MEYRREILSVTALNDRIKALLEGEFPSLWVEGEVSNLRRPASGHLYFTLKDARCQIRAVLFRGPYGRGGAAGFAVEEGMSLVCRARLTVYQPRGEYQLIVETVEPLGLGALQKAFEQLKARLEAEGLFAPERKKPVPFLPARIAVVTSPSGAVIRDILTVTRRRFPSIDLVIAPVRVQGAEAPAEIVRALDDLQGLADVDVIILARGGGSLEDLAPFNDEAVARAIARSRIPVISAVGHETDFTIADFVADLRAPTPSAAAELAVPPRAKLVETLAALRQRLVRGQRRENERLRERLAGLQGRLRDPKRRLADIRLALDDAMERLRLALDHRRIVRRQQWEHLAVRLAHRNPRARIAEWVARVERLGRDLRLAREKWDLARRNRLAAAATLLDSLSPLAVLNRGYGIVRRLRDGAILRSAAAAAVGEPLSLRLAEGSLHATVTDILVEGLEEGKEPPDGQGEV